MVKFNINNASIGNVNNVETLYGGLHVSGANNYVYNSLADNPKELLSRLAREGGRMNAEQVEVVAEVLQDSNDEKARSLGGQLMAAKDDEEKREGLIKQMGEMLKSVNEGFKLGENIAKYAPALVMILQSFGIL
jgi:hypothetical protein